MRPCCGDQRPPAEMLGSRRHAARRAFRLRTFRPRKAGKWAGPPSRLHKERDLSDTRCSSGSGCRPPRGETLAAKDRTALCWFEGHRRFLPALRASRAGLSLGEGWVTAGTWSAQHRDSLGFACLAALGFVFELLIVEEQLFTRGEDEIAAAIHALKNLILEFHDHSPHFPLAITSPREHNAPHARARRVVKHPPPNFTAPGFGPAALTRCSLLLCRSDDRAGSGIPSRHGTAGNGKGSPSGRTATWKALRNPAASKAGCQSSTPFFSHSRHFAGVAESM